MRKETTSKNKTIGMPKWSFLPIVVVVWVCANDGLASKVTQKASFQEKALFLLFLSVVVIALFFSSPSACTIVQKVTLAQLYQTKIKPTEEREN
jgi:hypothetical protein